MDAEGARALARRIAAGPPAGDAKTGVPRTVAADPVPEDLFEPRARYGVRIAWTERTTRLAGDRPVVVVRRLCKTLVDGRWIVSVVRETVEPI
ncbi:MAG: hypothetical protein ACRDON_02215 [Gaiellaceae bacterium]